MSWRDHLSDLEATAPDRILPYLQAQAAENPDDLDLQFERARHAQAAADYYDAIGALIPVSRQPGHQQFLASLQLGECFEKLNDPESATLAYQQAGGLDPGSHWPASHLARLAEASAGHDAAMAILRAALPPLRPDGRAAIIRAIADLTAAKKFNAERLLPNWRIVRGMTLPALQDAVMIMLVKDEADIIGQSLRHHHQLGFRRFCILDNHSTDGTAAIIAKFRDATPDTTVLYLHDPLVGYYQSAKMIAAQKLCEAYMPIAAPPPSWFFFIDADEFITFAGTGNLPADAKTLNDALLDNNANLLIMHWIHSAPASLHDSLPPDADMFAANPIFCPLLDPRVPKIAYRAGSNLDLMMGNHFVSAYPYPIDNAIIAAEQSLFLFHFSLRSLAHVKRKIINGGLAYQQAQGLEEHGGHWRKRYELYQQHGEPLIANILARHIRETQKRK